MTPASRKWKSTAAVHPNLKTHVPERPIASRSVLIASTAFMPQLQRPQPFWSFFFERNGSARKQGSNLRPWL
jgi:hypothetical protein